MMRGDHHPAPVATPSLPPISPLRGLLEVTKLMRAEGDLPELLAAIARTISESLGYRTVVVNLYRPAWDNFSVTTVHGNDEARRCCSDRCARWRGVGAAARATFERRGAYVVPAGAYDWEAELDDRSYVPDTDARARRARLASRGRALPADAPLRRPPARHPLRRRADERSQAHGRGARRARGARGARALAVQSAQEGEAGRAAPARARAPARRVVPADRRACDGRDPARRLPRRARRARLPERARGAPRSRVGPARPARAVGWAIEDVARRRPVFLHDIEGLIDPAFEIEGCYLLPNDEAERRICARPRSRTCPSRTGAGPMGVGPPLAARAAARQCRRGDRRALGGRAERPVLPSRDTLQALRVFANQAAAAVVASAHLNEVRFLADHDPLTRLLNRRAFVERLDGEVARATRYGHSFGARPLRPRRLQGAQRPLRPSRRRRGAPGVRAHAPVGAAQGRRGVPHRRRRVRAAPRRSVRVAMRARSCGASPSSARASARASASRRAPITRGDPQTLFRLADAALYEAKRSGTGPQVRRLDPAAAPTSTCASTSGATSPQRCAIWPPASGSRRRASSRMCWTCVPTVRGFGSRARGRSGEMCARPQGVRAPRALSASSRRCGRPSRSWLQPPRSAAVGGSAGDARSARRGRTA